MARSPEIAAAWRRVRPRFLMMYPRPPMVEAYLEESRNDENVRTAVVGLLRIRARWSASWMATFAAVMTTGIVLGVQLGLVAIALPQYRGNVRSGLLDAVPFVYLIIGFALLMMIAGTFVEERATQASVWLAAFEDAERRSMTAHRPSRFARLFGLERSARRR